MKEILKAIPWQVGGIVVLLIATGILEIGNWYRDPDNIRWSSVGLSIFHFVLAIGLLLRLKVARIIATAYAVYSLLISIVLVLFSYSIEKGFAPTEFPWDAVIYGTTQLGVIIWVFFYLTSDEAVAYFRGKKSSQEVI